MSAWVLGALLLSLGAYLGIGLLLRKKTRSLADFLPISSQTTASVRNANEFSASTVATTLSLATVVVAFFELAPYFGVWLYWCVLTTALGIALVRLFGRRIWLRLAQYPKRLSLHEFLGVSFGSVRVRRVSAFCTSLGFVGALATELTVGARFIAQLADTYPEWVFVVICSFVAFAYTLLGGFRAVILTDRLQMFAIWLLLLGLASFYVYFLATHGGWQHNYAKISTEIKSFTWRDSLPSFLLGIFIINTFAYMADMSIWQRIAGAQAQATVLDGLWKSVATTVLTWGLLITLACLSFVVIFPRPSENPLISLMHYFAALDTLWANLLIFSITLGLFGAMLSTASTQLIAVSHTIYEDLTSWLRRRSWQERLHSVREANVLRFILAGAAFAGVLVVELLRWLGFSIADLVFAIYGAQLGLLPPILLIVLSPAGSLAVRRYANAAGWAITTGFVVGWGSALVGKLWENNDAVFLAPGASLLVSSLVLGASMTYHALGDGTKKGEQNARP